MITTAILRHSFSSTGRSVERKARERRRRLLETRSLGKILAAEEELEVVWEECRTPGWDGHDAMPVDRRAYYNARRFLEALPLEFPAPTIGAEADGQVTLEWYRGPRRLLSMSVSGDGELHFAALFGPNQIYGTEVFFDEAPQRILSLIRQVYES